MIIFNIMEQLQIHHVNVHPKRKRRCNGMEQVLVYPIGYFDGASTKNIGGVGVHLKITEDYLFCIKMGCG